MPSRITAMRRAIHFGLAGALLLTAQKAAAQTEIRPESALTEADMMLLLPILDAHVLGEGLMTFPKGDRIYVPLGELSSLLSFGIRVDCQKGRAEGFFIQEKRRFLLDIPAGKLQVEGQSLPLAPGQAWVHEREIYVDVSLLAQCFPLEIDADLKSATLKIKAREKLPIQEAWDRELRFGQLKEGVRDGLEDPGLGRPLESPYRLWEMPCVDANLAWIKTQHVASAPILGTVTSGGDLFWMSSNLSLVRDLDGSFRNSRATLFREDPRGELLGPLRAQRVALGDLPLSPSLELAGSLPRGRGVLLDNYPMAYRSKFATRTFQGPLPEGWTVELYQNNGLVGYRYSRPDGRYEFPDIPLAFGLNQFRLIFHGPQGQTRQEQFRLDIQHDQPPPGAFYYRMAGVKPQLQGMPGLDSEPAAKKALSEPSYLIEGEYGLNRWLAVKGGATRMSQSDGPHDYGVLGLRSVFSFLSIQGSLAQERHEGGATGRAAEGVFRTGYGYSSLTLRRAEYRDGFMPFRGLGVADASLQLLSESQADLSGNLNWGLLPLSLGFSRETQEYAQGGRLERSRLHASLNWPAFSVSPSLSRVTDARNTWSPVHWEGHVMVSSYGARLSTQGELNFVQEKGKNELKTWSLSASTFTLSGLSCRMGMQGSGRRLKDTSLMANLNQMKGSFGYGMDVQYSRIGGYSIGLRLQISFAREPRSWRWVSDAQSTSAMGTLSARAFIDENANHKRDLGEPILDEARFRLGMVNPENRLNHPGIAFYTHLGASQEQLLRVDESSLEDPSQVPAFPAYRLMLRPGHAHQVDYPIHIQGEINGTTRLREGSTVRELGGLEIELVKYDGTPHKKWRTAFDGFFELRGIPPGAYHLRVTEAEQKRLGLKVAPSRLIQIDLKNNYFEGKDLVVEFAVPPAGDTVTPPGSGESHE